MTTDKERELEEMIAIAIPFRQRDCHIERGRKEYNRKELKRKLIDFYDRGTETSDIIRPAT